MWSIERNGTLRKSLSSTALLFVMFLGTVGISNAAIRDNRIDIVPTITNVGIQGGQLVASGTSRAIINGRTTSVPFSTPLTVTLAANQDGKVCPILDLHLDAIHLDLLGLVVQTSPICLEITAVAGGGLLGDLLCHTGQLLQNGLTMDQVLAGQGAGTLSGLNEIQVNSLLAGFRDTLNGGLPHLEDAVVTSVSPGADTCSILHLELGPVDLDLLGLVIVLDDCKGGPVVVDITGEEGPGNLLGNLLCGLLGPGKRGVGSTLREVLDSAANGQ